MERPTIEAQNHKGEAFALTGFFLLALSLFLHPLAVAAGLALYWYGRNRSFIRGLILGAAVPSLAFGVWYVFWGPGAFINEPQQPVLGAIFISPFVAGLMVPYAKLLDFLKPRSADEHIAEQVRHLERKHDKKRSKAMAQAKYLPEAVAGNLRLGTVLEWDDYPDQSGISQRGHCLTIGDQALNEHMLIIGQTGSGKTELIKRLIYEIGLNTSRGLYLVDGKGDPELAESVRAICNHTGRGNTPIVRLGHGIRGAPYYGFSASQPDALSNRLTEMISVTNLEGGAAWFGDGCRDLTQLLCLAEAGPPKSLAEVRHRLNRAWLKSAWSSHPHEIDVIARISDDDLESLGRRLRVLERPLSQVINEAGFALEETNTAVFSIRTQSVSDIATSFLRFVTEDFKDFTSPLRWLAESQSCMIIDEFGAFHNETIIELLQLARSAGLGIILATQDVSALGDEHIQRRIMANTTTTILLRSMYPENVAELAGTKFGVESSVQYFEGDTTGLGSARVQHQFKISPDSVRSLATGEAYAIRANKAARMMVAKIPDAELETMRANTPEEQITPLTAEPEVKTEPIKKVEL
ncbi:MAG: TraM recognition domain-containing protein [Anaerolineae bacterium]|nr:TraM recognition domain-containing protein [Anaerolineae bacterium]